MNNRDADLLSKWGPGLASWPVPLAAYLGLAIMLPDLLGSRLGFLAGLAAAALAASLLVALVSRALGLYVRNPHGEPRSDPQRQGIFATQTALLVAYFVLPRLGVEQPLWLYAIAFFLLGAIGMAVHGAVAGRKAKLRVRNTMLPPTPQQPLRARPPANVAPRWAQQIAAICLALGAVALLRLVFGGEQYFMWAGIVLLAVGALLPSLVVLLGGGRPPE